MDRGHKLSETQQCVSLFPYVLKFMISEMLFYGKVSILNSIIKEDWKNFARKD